MAAPRNHEFQLNCNLTAKVQQLQLESEGVAEVAKSEREKAIAEKEKLTNKLQQESNIEAGETTKDEENSNTKKKITENTWCLNNYIGLYNDNIISYRDLCGFLTKSKTREADKLINLYYRQQQIRDQMGLDLISRLRQLFQWGSSSTSNSVKDNINNTDSNKPSIESRNRSEDINVDIHQKGNSADQTPQKRKRR